MKVVANITLSFDAPASMELSEVWPLVRKFTSSVMWSQGAGLKNTRPEIERVLVDGKSIAYRGRG